MDLQPVVLEAFGPADPKDLLARVQSTIMAAREVGCLIVWVVSEFRPGYPDVSPRNKMLGPVREQGFLVSGADGTALHSDVGFRPEDVTVVKRRISAFAGTDLGLLLASRDVEQLVLLGVSTSGVVLSTLRAAADLDFRLTVLSDCCFDEDRTVRECLVDRIFPTQAEVLASSTWITTMKEGDSEL
jgi:nicotinamidase-related amidase